MAAVAVAFSGWLLATHTKIYDLSAISAVVNCAFYGGSGGGIDIGSGRNVQNVANIAVVAVENRWILSHLQRLVLVKVRGYDAGFADGKSLQRVLLIIVKQGESERVTFWKNIL